MGTADEIAEHLGELGEAVGGDGFLFTGQVHPAHVHRTLDPLVPALRRRGLIRTEFGGCGTARQPPGVLSVTAEIVTLGADAPTTADLVAIADGARVEIGPDARQAIEASRAVVEAAIADGRPVYGLNTRLGAGRDDRVGDDELLDYPAARHREPSRRRSARRWGSGRRAP